VPEKKLEFWFLHLNTGMVDIEETSQGLSIDSFDTHMLRGGRRAKLHFGAADSPLRNRQ